MKAAPNLAAISWRAREATSPMVFSPARRSPPATASLAPSAVTGSSAKFPWAATGRAIANGAEYGFTKLVFDEDTHRIIGGSIVGRLKNTGGAVVRSETQLLTTVDTEYSITLTAGEIAAIASGALSVQLESA